MFKWVYLSFSPLPLASLLLSASCKASSDNHFAFLHFLLWMVLITAFYTVLGTSILSSSGVLSIYALIPWIYLSLPLYNHKGFNLGHTWMVLGLQRVGHDWATELNWTELNGVVIFPTFFNLSLNLAIRISFSEPHSAPSLVFADSIEHLHLWPQRI